ncbi:hypothetical protein HDG34_002527 [Paraburkholderia sp. HC6.4b]|uniref:hypothetical protein n=1 Tax=unclassified Paraburkholderia TaxID=2615204 RepID=UPI00160C489A|nr:MULTISPECIES: hypothetical protein [unclassified Paraburkholderia]MBB5408590.1 hypothetical protein [Paraburkholderia sp. HC6.4b]MBB5450422.1 hypothetical protein [Paraburkholderia sp. Kb1A]
MPDGISIREFARREHVSDTLVHQALKQGRLAKRADGLMDPALLGTRWRASERRGEAANGPAKDTLQPGGTAKGLAYGEALRIKENWTALLRRLEYEQKSGALVELAVARGVVFELCREQRDAWLAWPAKVAPFIAMAFGIDDIDRLTNTLAAHVHQQLADLGEPEPRFDAEQGR